MFKNVFNSLRNYLMPAGEPRRMYGEQMVLNEGSSTKILHPQSRDKSGSHQRALSTSSIARHNGLTPGKESTYLGGTTGYGGGEIGN
jgi:hypothetical protein